MSIVSALLSETVLQAALGLNEAGLSVIPVTGKVNSVKWYKFQTQRATSGLIHWWDFHDKLHGVAIVCGRVSGRLVIVDCDGDEAVQTYEQTFPHLLDTLTVVSGSRHGKHYYYFTDEWMPTTRTKGWELRSDGCYVVAPPSAHPTSCLAYCVERYAEPQRLPDLNDVRRWIGEKVAKNQREGLTRPAQPGNVISANRYVQAALSGECDNVRRAPDGQRNNALFVAALRMGNFIGMGRISQSEVESALMSAAAFDDDTDAQRLRTIRSGIERGMQNNKRSIG